MDKLDLRLMSELMRDSRIPVTRLAKKLGVSREVANYRLNKLRKGKVVLDFVTEIDLEKLGFIGAAIFIGVKAARQEEFRNFLDACPFVSWVAELSGEWGFGFSIYAKSNGELDEKFQRIYESFKDDIIDHRFTLHRRTTFFYEKYFGPMRVSAPRKTSVGKKTDGIDKLILKELSRNSRLSSVELSKKLSLTPPAVIQRIRRLEVGGVIGKYSIFVDVSKLGLLQYSVFIVNKSVGVKERLAEYLASHPSVSYAAEYVGDPFVEFGVVVKDPYDLRRILQEIEGAFPDNRVIEISLFQKELVSVGPPACVFE